jgi:hypothetical protein
LSADYLPYYLRVISKNFDVLRHDMRTNVSIFRHENISDNFSDILVLLVKVYIIMPSKRS